jgi:hypothetical protein
MRVIRKSTAVLGVARQVGSAVGVALLLGVAGASLNHSIRSSLFLSPPH